MSLWVLSEAWDTLYCLSTGDQTYRVTCHSVERQCLALRPSSRRLVKLQAADRLTLMSVGERQGLGRMRREGRDRRQTEG